MCISYCDMWTILLWTFIIYSLWWTWTFILNWISSEDEYCIWWEERRFSSWFSSNSEANALELVENLGEWHSLLLVAGSLCSLNGEINVQWYNLIIKYEINSYNPSWENNRINGWKKRMCTREWMRQMYMHPEQNVDVFIHVVKWMRIEIIKIFQSSGDLLPFE